MKALVIGGTGKCGRETVLELLKRKEVETVKLLLRSPKDNDFWEQPKDNPKLVKTIVDFDNIQNFEDEFVGFSHGFCALGTTRKAAGSAENFKKVDFDYIVNCAKLLKSNGTNHFSLVSSVGANPNSWFLYPSTKGKTEEAVKELQFERLTIFRPGFLFGRNGSGRPLESFFSKISPSFLGVNIQKVGFALVQNALQTQKGNIEIFENSEIKEI